MKVCLVGRRLKAASYTPDGQLHPSCPRCAEAVAFRCSNMCRDLNKARKVGFTLPVPPTLLHLLPVLGGVHTLWPPCHNEIKEQGQRATPAFQPLTPHTPPPHYFTSPVTGPFPCSRHVTEPSSYITASRHLGSAPRPLIYGRDVPLCAPSGVRPI